MSDNTTQLIVILALIVMGVLCAGSPDLLDARIARIGGGNLS